MKYRVKKVNGMYYVQYKKFLFWQNCCMMGGKEAAFISRSDAFYFMYDLNLNKTGILVE